MKVFKNVVVRIPKEHGYLDYGLMGLCEVREYSPRCFKFCGYYDCRPMWGFCHRRGGEWVANRGTVHFPIRRT